MKKSFSSFYSLRTHQSICIFKDLHLSLLQFNMLTDYFSLLTFIERWFFVSWRGRPRADQFSLFTDVYHQGLNTSYWYLKAEREEKKTRRWKGKLLRSIETLLHVYWITVNSASHSVDGNNIEQKRGASFLLFKGRKRLYSSATKVLKTTIY